MEYNPYLIAALKENIIGIHRVDIRAVSKNLVIFLGVPRSVAQLLELLDTASSKIWGNPSISPGYVMVETPY